MWSKGEVDGKTEMYNLWLHVW